MAETVAADLRTRLTATYAGLFGVALLLVALAVGGAYALMARRQVASELTAAGMALERLAALDAQRLADEARTLARDPALREPRTLEEARGRANVDRVYVVGKDGTLLGQEATLGLRDQMLSALKRGVSHGVLQVGGEPYQAVAAPTTQPGFDGWAVVARKLDGATLARIEPLFAAPVDATLVTKTPGGWIAPGVSGEDAERLAGLAAKTLQDPKLKAARLATSDGAALAVAKPLQPFGGAPTTLVVLRHSGDLAAASPGLLILALLAAGLIGLAAVVMASTILARRLVLPIAALDQAARRLESGEPARIDAAGEDELGRLAKRFNSMAAAIIDRETRLTNTAWTDQETGLPNRHAFEAAIRKAQGRSVMVIGIDRYAELRTALGYGHAAAVTRAIGARLAALWPDAVLAKLSGERLGLLMETLRSEAAADLLVGALEEPLVLGGVTVDVAINAGLAQIDSDEPIPAVERASIALEQARAAGRKVALFDAAAYGDPALKLSLMSEMLSALKDGSIALHYQPKYSLTARAVTGAEALVRWRHPTRGSVPPDVFVPLAEDTGHIRALTRWTLQQIIADQARLREAGHDLMLSLNLSGRLVGDAPFIEEAIAAVKTSGARLCFEITETAAIGSQDAALSGIEALRAAGVAISIDDYGAGLSSLSYLKELPADELKIDKAFVQALSESARDALLVKSTVDLAHSLGLKVVAEGVETPQALALLSGMGCDMAQGWHIAKALPLEKLKVFLREDAALEGWIAAAG